MNRPHDERRREDVGGPPPSDATHRDDEESPGPPVAASFVYDGQDLESLADLPNYNRWILRRFGGPPTGRVLEVGAGIGNFAAHYVDETDELVLLEPAGNLFDRLAGRFAKQDRVSAVSAYVEDWIDPEHLATFDHVVLVNVLEHVEDDARLLRLLHVLLRPGGTLLLFVPAMSWLYGTLDETVDHFRRYSRRGLRTLLESQDFDVMDLRFFDTAGVLPWFVLGRILRRRRFDAAAAVGFDRLVAPAMSRLEGWFRPPFGKNLLAVCRRRMPAYMATEDSA